MRISDWSSDVCSSDLDGCEDDIVFDLFSAIIGHCAEYRGIYSLEADEGMICLFVLEFMTRFGRRSTDAIGHPGVETFAVMIDCPVPSRMAGKFGQQTAMRLIGHLSDRKSTRLNSSH